MTKTSQQLAEELVRKCADAAIGWTMGEDEWDEYKADKTAYEGLQSKILQSIPLGELLECVGAYDDVELFEPNMADRKQRKELIENLTTKLKQLGIDT